MSQAHHVLIVEDDPAMGEELRQLVDGLGFTSELVDNQHDAVLVLGRQTFCLILLDLSIKRNPDSIAGHTEAGFSVLAEVRRLWPSRVPGHRIHHFPVMVVSGHMRDADDGWRALEAGADEILPKPLNDKRGTPAEKIRRCLHDSGREMHSSCQAAKPQAPALASVPQIPIVVTGQREKRRNEIIVAGRKTSLTSEALFVLLSLWSAYLKGKQAKHDGRTSGVSYAGVSRLRSDLRNVVPENFEVVESLHYGEYVLNPRIELTEIACDGLLQHEVTKIREVCRQLLAQLSG